MGVTELKSMGTLVQEEETEVRLEGLILRKTSLSVSEELPFLWRFIIVAQELRASLAKLF